MTLEDTELDRRLSALPRQTDIDQRHWQAIEARLQAPPRRWPRFMAAAAGIAACLAVALLLVDQASLPSGNDASVVIAAEISAMRAQAAGLEADWDGQDLEMAGAWDENQDAIEELERALARHPDNPMLMDFLAQARLRQAQLVQQATAGGALAQQGSQTP
jgi:hypothetical protein